MYPNATSIEPKLLASDNRQSDEQEFNIKNTLLAGTPYTSYEYNRSRHIYLECLLGICQLTTQWCLHLGKKDGNYKAENIHRKLWEQTSRHKCCVCVWRGRWASKCQTSDTTTPTLSVYSRSALALWRREHSKKQQGDERQGKRRDRK